MRIESIDGLVPQKDLVIVDIQPREQGGLYLGGNEEASKLHVEMYYGIVDALGPQTGEPEHCPGLQTDDIAIFSQFAGSYIATNDQKLHKIIRGYDIMAITTNLEEITEETVTPMADRLLVTGLKQEVTEGGLFLNEDDSRDPRLADIRYGYVLKAGQATNGSIPIGTLVAYDMHVGEAIRAQSSDDSPELRVIREDDILFIKL